MFRRFTSKTVVTKTVTEGGKTVTERTETTTDDPEAGKAFDAKAAETLDELFAGFDQMLDTPLFGGLWGRRKKKVAEPEPPAPTEAEVATHTKSDDKYPPDFLANAPGSASIAQLGSLSVFRFKGRYYAFKSNDPTLPVGYYALDTMQPTDGQR